MILEYLDGSRADIEAKLFKQLKPFVAVKDYTTIWKDYEDRAIIEMIKIIRSEFSELTKKNFAIGKPGKSKNRVEDLFVIYKDEAILIAVKACRASGRTANDLGTFRQYPSKKAKYTGIFDIWIRYDDSNLPPKVTGVFFDRSFKFAGRMSEKFGGGVSYRKKDGNMRPKSWAMFDDGTCHWNTLQEFETGMKKSIIFRANALVEQHLATMSEDDQRALYESLRAKFGNDA
jgi:hypothetical protein